jgi:hypothetical protein
VLRSPCGEHQKTNHHHTSTIYLSDPHSYSQAACISRLANTTLQPQHPLYKLESESSSRETENEDGNQLLKFDCDSCEVNSRALDLQRGVRGVTDSDTLLPRVGARPLSMRVVAWRGGLPPARRPGTASSLTVSAERRRPSNKTQSQRCCSLLSYTCTTSCSERKEHRSSFSPSCDKPRALRRCRPKLFELFSIV